MFQWYQKAAICYAYLSDVPNGDSGSRFSSSRWFTRGWTLQELLAPRELYFYDATWSLIGMKTKMATVVQQITGIPRPFLVGWASLHEASISQRMSWAANRVTKRKEDIAYCLLGIFGITMPMIYGEDDRAFRRLQMEIIKDVEDDSIFAWGLSAREVDSNRSPDAVAGGLLAASPSDFANCGHIGSRLQYSVSTNRYEISNGRLWTELPLFSRDTGETYGLLKCGPEWDDEKIVGIPLWVRKLASN